MQHTRRVITVYPFTGRQLFFRIPHSWCQECQLSIRAVERIAADLPHVEVRVRPWFNHLVAALRQGGWHPPVVTIDGVLFSQGIVPNEVALRAALTGDRAAAPRSTTPSTVGSARSASE